ncbi:MULTISPECIES: DUF4166 domain-containing protein [Microbacterium]|uniref:DUF4166 domain-containing protein n=1 Tax=Microbacterium maritypicum TaxID=33918 RepID=A0AAJ5VDC7_MICMQ|nr:MULTISPECIES: DUF4166 domain-containing protein [Microbacterium]EYT58441.1 hypothetical protein D514_0115370 [Microbacterium sp. UCD-TDU]WEF22131.1 DUF4166 domain-containing protein [Microbacterium liquefaciens]
MTARGAAFLEALGEQAQRLHPEILAQMSVEATRDSAEGVFAVAGSRFGRVAGLAAPVIGPGLLVTRFARDVPFRIDTVSGRSRAGRATLDTVREFRFPGATQYVTDRLFATGHPGIVQNALGVRGRVQMLEHCSVTDEGALRMSTRAVALRLGRYRIALRGILRIEVELVDGWDEARHRRTIDMRATSPVLGTVLEYRGWYRYADRTAPDVTASDAGGVSDVDQ